MKDMITDWHRERIAYIYVRQSSPGQVRDHQESAIRQRGMRRRAQALGWPDDRIVVLGGDTGKSGRSSRQRDDYKEMLDGVRNDKVGMIMACEVSRLARNSPDWMDIVRYCRGTGVLIADQDHTYNALDCKDRVHLYIQAAFSEYEVDMNNARMRECRDQKAKRGHLWLPVQPGYICTNRKLYALEKHPDPRVRRALEYVFCQFDRAPSVRQLHRRLFESEFLMPAYAHDNWREVAWVAPVYESLVSMLQNPAYAGYYAYGRTEIVEELDKDGHIRKRRIHRPEEDWIASIPNHHPAYISEGKWRKNMARIEANQNMKGELVKGAEREGRSVVSGLLRCRRCGHRLSVHYGKDQIAYRCHKGTRHRQPYERHCLMFSSLRAETRLVEEILYAVSAVGIEASEEAAVRLAKDHARLRQTYVDQVAACEEKARRAERELRITDEAFREVRHELTAQWNEALRALRAQQTRLRDFDERQPGAPTRQERALLSSLGEDLGKVWHHPSTSNQVKSRIVRTLIEEIVVDVDQEKDEVVWFVHWVGGYHSELRVPRRVIRKRPTIEDLKRVIRTLSKVLDDAAIATTLNRESVYTRNVSRWTKAQVASFRERYAIVEYSAQRKTAHGWLTQAEAATYLRISPMSVTRLVENGIICAEKPFARLPAVICRADLDRVEVKRRVLQLNRAAKRPLPENPDQLTLFDVTG